jgi:hypothetical protein
MVCVYLASPYTLPEGEQQFNVVRQLEAADNLMDLGYCPVVPLFSLYQHELFPRPYADWMRIDLEKIRRCDVVLRLPGESAGADQEIEHARILGIPVVFSIEELQALKVKDVFERKENELAH